MKRHEFVKSNLEIIKELAELGITADALLAKYLTYKEFETLNNDIKRSRGEAYDLLARRLFGRNGKARSVSRRVNYMEKEISIGVEVDTIVNEDFLERKGFNTKYISVSETSRKINSIIDLCLKSNDLESKFFLSEVLLNLSKNILSNIRDDVTEDI